MSKSKPLVERVEWQAARDDNDWFFHHAGIVVHLSKCDYGRWMVIWGHRYKTFRLSKAKGGLDAAKREAVRVVQTEVLKAADEWRD